MKKEKLQIYVRNIKWNSKEKIIAPLILQYLQDKVIIVLKVVNIVVVVHLSHAKFVITSIF